MGGGGMAPSPFNTAPAQAKRFETGGWVPAALILGLFLSTLITRAFYYY